MPDQPFLYDPHESRRSLAYPYSDFNPRAATQAHYAAFQQRAERNKARAAQDGRPLINFNAHPDSYMVVSNPEVHHEPMPANTKKMITSMRWVQFVFRVVQEIGALGLLVCVICLKMKNDGPGWIIRVAPAWDVVVTMYAIYHLLRPANGRTPYTSSSYHFFALFMDTGLVPFYAFIALYANQNYNLQVGTDDRWTSFFSTNYATTTVIYVTFLGTIVMGGLHLVSVALDLYLIVMFRKIARLPPDMNPLEDNLTGSNRRRSQKHKHKNSDMSAISGSTAFSERKPGYMSGSTLDVSGSRLSVAKEPDSRTIPWSHSRMDSDATYSPHNPNSARLSRQQYDEVTLQQGPLSARSSRVDVSGGGHRSRAGTVVGAYETAESVDYGILPPVPNFSRGGSPGVTQSKADRHNAAPVKDNVKSQQKAGLLNDNWYVLEDGEVSDLGSPRRNKGHSREPTLPNVELPAVEGVNSFRPQPLKMNPPTPPPQAGNDSEIRYNPVETGVARSGTVQSQATITSSVYSESAPSLKSSGTPKGKRYGDLASAANGVRNGNTGALPAFPGMGNYGMPSPQSSRTPSPQKKQARVISRTGVDIADANLHTGNELRGRRDVSGKIAEEGRGGWSMTPRSDSIDTIGPDNEKPAIPVAKSNKSKRYYAQRTRSWDPDDDGEHFGNTEPHHWHLVLSGVKF